MSLWAGVDLKVSYAGFFLGQMTSALQPQRTQTTVALEGTIVGNLWQQSFYPNFDAFLAMTRSIPEVIKCCFGKDPQADSMPCRLVSRRDARRSRLHSNRSILRFAWPL